ncbi:Spermidine synthase, partial [Durusdinium trenchii]
MMTRLAASGLPLLAKELIEQAARRRTYIVRSAYAFLLFMFVTLIFWGEVYDRSSSPFDLLGQGRTMFQIVLMLQTAGVLLFTPALTCGAITIEKERNTFGLLLLTRLSPSTILLEKYLGRLVMMGTFLLLSLPLLGLCYTIGGVTQLDLWSGFAALVITVMQLSAVGLCCSAYFRTTTGAFFGAYIFGFLLLFGPAMTLFIDDDFVEWMADGEAQLVEYAVELCVAVGWYAINAWDQLLGLDSFAVDFRQNQALVSQPLSYGEEDGAFLFFAVPRMMVIERFWTAPPTWQVAVRGLPALMSIPSILLLARFFMVRRAFVGPSNYLLSFFRRLDSVFHRMNQNRWTKGIVLVNDTQSLPKENPVAWRETTKRTLGTVRYLVRVFVALEFPILMFCLIVLTVTAHRSSDRNGAITFVIIIAWLAAILLVTVKAADVEPEPGNQRVDSDSVRARLAALLYQTAWMRQFAVVFGTSELAVATVLAAYMAGLAAGAALVGRFVHRVRRPLFVYGVLEFCIAAGALAVVPGLRAIRSLQIMLIGGQPELPDAGGLAQPLFYVAAAFVVLFIPTACMGATLPLLTRFAVRTDQQLGRRVGVLYAVNTLGAVFGTLGAAFLLLPGLGLFRTTLVGVAANVAIFALAVLLTRSSKNEQSSPSTEPAAVPHSPFATRWTLAHNVLPIMLISGLTSFVYEVLWSRLLGQLIGGSVYAFATMLATFLTGITLGSAVASRLARDRVTSWVGFIAVQVGTAATSVAVFYILDSLPELASRWGASADSSLWASAGLCAIVLLPSTLCIGATFPFAVRLLAGEAKEAGPVSASVYAWNTVGGVCGALLAGFVIVPELEFAGTVKFAALTNLGLAFAT